MTELRQQDIDRVVKALPEEIVDHIKGYGLILAGGFIRDIIAGRTPHDIDLFGTEADLKAAADSLAWNWSSETTPWATTFTARFHAGLKVQLITGFPVAERFDTFELLGRFNFTVSQAAIFYDDPERGMPWGGDPNPQWYGDCSDDFYPDLAARKLVYTGGQDQVNATKSLHKATVFLTEGFFMEPESLFHLVADATEYDKWNRAVIKKELLDRIVNKECNSKGNTAVDVRWNSLALVSSATSPARAAMASIY